MSQYGKTEYWQQRYIRDPQPFDWYQRYFSLRQLIGQHVPTQYRILNVGAGNSRMSQEMSDDGYQSITNIDFSSTSVKTMSEKHKQRAPNLKYQPMDVRAMQFADGSFDCVIDKGTFDSVVCGQGSTTNANKMTSEIYRVLANNGVYLMISFGPESTRMHHLAKADYEWLVQVFPLPKPTIAASICQANKEFPEKNNHYMYVCTKGKKLEKAEVEEVKQVTGDEKIKEKATK